MDVISLFPMEIFYYFTGVNSLLRFPRLLKVRMYFTSCIIQMFVLLGVSTGKQLTQVFFFSQYMVFFEFNDRMEAVMKKAYIYR